MTSTNLSASRPTVISNTFLRHDFSLKVLVAEDNRRLTKLLLRALTENGHLVEVVGDGEQVLALTSRTTFDVIILDWMLPSLDGLSVCRKLRSSSYSAAIIMLTARSDTRERIVGLDAGADDFLPKPFDLEELLARVRALGRRCNLGRYVQVGQMHIDRIDRVAVLAGERLMLTPREFDLLHLLVSSAGQVVARDDILQKLWGDDPVGNVVDVNVKHLRTKLNDRAWHIHTVRGVGYTWTEGSIG